MIQWKDIIGYEGLYQVSNTGLVKSLSRAVKSVHSNKWYTKQDRILKPEITLKGLGYYRVQLCKDCIINKIPVHRIVAMTFILNPENKPQVNHIDGNKLNNHVENLEWATASENVQHAFDTGLNIPSLSSTYIPEQIRILVRSEYIKGSKKFGCIAIGEKYGIGKQTVLNIVNEVI